MSALRCCVSLLLAGWALIATAADRSSYLWLLHRGWSAFTAVWLTLEQDEEAFVTSPFEIPAETPDQFAAVVRAEIAKWGPIVKQAGIGPD